MAGRIRTWLRGLLRRRAVERVLDEEIRACVDILTEERIRAGTAPEVSRREALLEVGHVERVKEQARDARPGARLEAWGRDLRHGARLLRRQPWMAAAAVATLTIGIAAPTSVFSLLSAFAFRAPVSVDPDAYFRLVRTDSSSGLSGAALHYTGAALTVALVIIAVLAFIARSTAARDPLPLLRDE